MRRTSIARRRPSRRRRRPRRRAPAGSPAATAARRSRARTRCRASSTRRCAPRQSTSPSDSEIVGVRARVADGVEVVVDAHDGDAVAVDVEARRRAGRDVVGATQRDGGGHGVRLLRRRAWRRSRRADERPRPAHRQAVEHLVEEAGDDEPLGAPRAARPGSRGRSAGPRRSGRPSRRGCSCTSLFSISRFGTDSAHASSRQLDVAVGLEGVGAAGVLPTWISPV